MTIDTTRLRALLEECRDFMETAPMSRDGEEVSADRPHRRRARRREGDDMTNDQMDAAIRDALKDGPRNFTALNVFVDSRFKRDCFRHLDRRLQALRKAGEIKPDRRVGWSLDAVVGLTWSRIDAAPPPADAVTDEMVEAAWAAAPECHEYGDVAVVSRDDVRKMIAAAMAARTK